MAKIFHVEHFREKNEFAPKIEREMANLREQNQRKRKMLKTKAKKP